MEFPDDAVAGVPGADSEGTTMHRILLSGSAAACLVLSIIGNLR